MKRSRFIKVTRESKALKLMRENLELSVRKMANQLNVSPSLVSHLEMGRANISSDYINLFKKTFKISDIQWRKALAGQVFKVSQGETNEALELFHLLQDLPKEKLSLLKKLLSA